MAPSLWLLHYASPLCKRDSEIVFIRTMGMKVAQLHRGGDSLVPAWAFPLLMFVLTDKTSRIKTPHRLTKPTTGGKAAPTPIGMGPSLWVLPSLSSLTCAPHSVQKKGGTVAVPPL